MDTNENLTEGRAGDSQTMIIRDDQMDFAALLDLVKERRKNHRRLGLIDSGAFDPFQMEWLGEAGADIYTSNRARQNLSEFVLIGRAAAKGDALTAYFHHGPFLSEEKENTVPFSALKEMGRSGIDIHLSNKQRSGEWGKLEELADACAAGTSRLVIYHHGPLGPELESLVRRGAWIHVSDASLRNDGDVVLLTDCLAAARARGVQLIFHLEHNLPLAWLENIFAAGAFVLFKIPPTDYRSRLRPFEQASKKRQPDFRATYIDATFLL
jgi:hypothetical protein